MDAGQRPVSRLYKNNRDGTFTDVTMQAGIARTGWGAAAASAISITTGTTISS